MQPCQMTARLHRLCVVCIAICTTRANMNQARIIQITIRLFRLAMPKEQMGGNTATHHVASVGHTQRTCHIIHIPICINIHMSAFWRASVGGGGGQGGPCLGWPPSPPCQYACTLYYSYLQTHTDKHNHLGSILYKDLIYLLLIILFIECGC